MNLLNLSIPVMSRLKPVFGIYFASTVLAFSQSVPNKHVITHEDVWLMKRVGAPVPSPDSFEPNSLRGSKTGSPTDVGLE